MFDEDISYGEAIDYVLDDDQLPSIRDDLQSMGGTVADNPCSECDGTMYELDYEVVCAECSLVRGSDDSTRSKTSRWEHFREHRPEHWNSNRKRCAGGFIDPYDWVEREDVDHPIKEVEPSAFYR